MIPYADTLEHRDAKARVAEYMEPAQELAQELDQMATSFDVFRRAGNQFSILAAERFLEGIFLAAAIPEIRQAYFDCYAQAIEEVLGAEVYGEAIARLEAETGIELKISETSDPING
jgi:hypothetical protein